MLIELLYLQVVRDTFSSICIRISEAERTNMKTYLCKSSSNLKIIIFFLLNLASHGVVVVGDIDLINKLSAKKSVIEQARQWPTYFCRFFPVSVRKFHRSNILSMSLPSLSDAKISLW